MDSIDNKALRAQLRQSPPRITPRPDHRRQLEQTLRGRLADPDQVPVWGLRAYSFVLSLSLLALVLVQVAIPAQTQPPDLAPCEASIREWIGLPTTEAPSAGAFVVALAWPTAAPRTLDANVARQLAEQRQTLDQFLSPHDPTL